MHNDCKSNLLLDSRCLCFFIAACSRPAVGLGKQMCKLGPALPFSSTQKNCLVIGDSVSIGYTPAVASSLSGECFVQHR
jgi:hypothetical protein